MNANTELTNRLTKVAHNYHPLCASFELTTRCNASCDYCYLQSEPKLQELSTVDCKAVINKLDDAGVLFLGITGGEPFIRDDILDILFHITTKGFFKTNILSNGTLLTDKHIDFIVKHKIYFPSIQLSVFSHIHSVHDKYMGVSGGLDRIIHNGKRLLAGGVSVYISVNVLECNLYDYEKARSFFSNLGFYVDISMTKLLPNKNKLPIYKQLTSKEFFSKAFKTLDPVKKKYQQTFIAKQIAMPETNTALCKGLTNGIAIDSNGFLCPCISLRNIKVGSILETRHLHDILKSSKPLTEIRALRKTDIDGCKTCENINACSVCVGIAYSEHANLRHRPDQFCNFLHAMIESECSECLLV